MPRLALVVALLLVIIASFAPQALFSDPAWQLLALKQWREGRSPAFNHLTMADPADLAHDRSEWIEWWPPGLQIAMLPLGWLPIGRALRLVAVVFYLVGTVGWARYAAAFSMPRWALATVSAAVPLMRYANAPLLQYSMENMAFGISPWILVLALRRSRWTGLLAGAAYWMKFSTVFVSMGALAYLFFRKRRAFWAAVFLFAGCVLALTGLAYHYGASANNAVASFGLQFRPLAPIRALGNIGLMLGDMNAALSYILLRTGRASQHTADLLFLFGLPVGLLVGWLVWRSEQPLPKCLLVAGLGGMSLVWLTSGATDMDARHMAGAALGLLAPTVAAGLPYRQLAPVAALWLVVPWLYGAGSFALKTARDASYRPSQLALRQSLLDERDAQTSVTCLTTLRPELWYVTDPGIAQELPARVLVRHADFLDADKLRQERYHSSRPLRIAALIPNHFEENGKGDIIRGSFADTAWQAGESCSARQRLWWGETR